MLKSGLPGNGGGPPAWRCAPAALLVLLVHGLPAVGGLLPELRAQRLRISPLYARRRAVADAAANADCPLRSASGAVRDTAIFAFFTVGGTLVGGLAVPSSSTARSAASASSAG